MTWEEFWGGVAAGFIAIVIWEVWLRLRRRRRLRKQYAHLAGEYSVTRKLQPDVREPGTAVITVKGNVLSVRFRDLPPGRSVTGEISMNEQLRRSGRGHYYDAEDGKDLWGYWDLQVVPSNTLLIHTTFAQHEEHRAVVSGFVWTRRNATDVRS